MKDIAVPLIRQRVPRTDLWWAAPLATGAALVAFGLYTAWAVLQNGNYYAEPYLSPLYSPCLAASCPHAVAAVLGASWSWSPALLVLWVPVGLRVTCYYYRKAYYRSFFLSPPACAIPDAARRYSGESRFPLVLQNLHRYFFYLSLPMLAFIWWDAALGFRYRDGPGIGVGSLVLLANAALLTLFAASCNSCRHLCGGHVKSLHDAPARRRVWSVATRLNVHHREYAWVSLAGVVLADAYVRLLAAGVIHDLRII